MNFDGQIIPIINQLQNEPEEKPKGFLAKMFPAGPADPDLVNLAKEEIDEFQKRGWISEPVASQVKNLPGRQLFKAIDKISEMFKQQGVSFKK